MTSNMPTVSVVIPLYNARTVIHETIESVLAQTWKDYEIIVVDDGSTDGSDEVVRQFTGRARLVSRENGGVAKARNLGIEQSSGKYVALLDHDDLWHPTKLEKQVAVLERNPLVGMVITDVAHVDRLGRRMGIVGAGYNPKETFARLFVRGYVPTPSAAMIRRSVLESVGTFDESFYSAGMDDHELWTRIAAEYDMANIPEPLTYHRNLTIKPAHVALDHRALLIEKLMERFGDDRIKHRYLLRERAMHLADLAKQRLKDGSLQEGRELLVRGLSLSLGKAPSLKTGWRCLSRLAKSYLSHNR